MTADEMMDYRGKGNGVFIRATETPHSAAPDPAMLETVAGLDVDYESGRWPSLEENAEGYVLQLDTMRWFRSHLHDVDGPLGEMADDFRVAPIRAVDHAGLPSAHVMVAGYDPLRDEGLGYAEVLTAAGVPTTTAHHADQVHGYWQFAPLVTSSGAARAADLESLRATIAALPA